MAYAHFDIARPATRTPCNVHQSPSKRHKQHLWSVFARNLHGVHLQKHNRVQLSSFSRFLRSNDYRKGDCYNRYCLSFKHALYFRAALTRLQGELCSFSWSCTGSVRQVPSSSSRRTSGNDCGATVPSWTTLREGSSLSEDISRTLTPPWGTTRNAKRGTMPTCVGSGRRDSSPTSSMFP